MSEDKQPIPLGFGDPVEMKAWKPNYDAIVSEVNADAQIWHGLADYNAATTASTASDVTIEDLKESILLMREAMKRPEGYIDVLLMTYQQWERLKELVTAKIPEQNDMMGVPWSFAGLPVEAYPTKAEVDARAKVLRSEGKTVGMVEEGEKP